MDTNRFIVHIKTDDNYNYIAEDVETRFDISNFELDWPYLEEKKVIGMMKDKLGGQIMKKLFG